MVPWLKAIHIATLVIWCGGLIALPSLFAMRGRFAHRELEHDFHRMVRDAFVRIVSPAAFVAVASGAALIFAREVFTPWMILKLVFVGMLVGLHVRQGYVLVRLFEPGRRYARWRQLLATGATVVVACCVLFLVLGKPDLDPALLPDVMRQPGGLQSLLETMMPMP
ncbi:CopD family protein [Faunimonas sp. B44]|uniref:CopD family protein n=1 Tax=Faunimonas sp. B44 TaxID=3461493 RepID=UPI004044F865